jgi:hypothetical protein
MTSRRTWLEWTGPSITTGDPTLAHHRSRLVRVTAVSSRIQVTRSSASASQTAGASPTWVGVSALPAHAANPRTRHAAAAETEHREHLLCNFHLTQRSAGSVSRQRWSPRNWSPWGERPATSTLKQSTNLSSLLGRTSHAGENASASPRCRLNHGNRRLPMAQLLRPFR